MKKTIRTLRSMGFKAASKGDQAFADMHPVQVVDAHDEKVSKTLQDIANAKGVIPYDRVANKHGYEKGEDEAAYDSFKHNAGGPVVAPVYTKPMYEGVRSCPHCQGKACEHCNETGYAIEEGEHSNAVVRHLRRQKLDEGKRLKALGRALKDEGPEMMKHMAVQVGALTPAGALMGGKTMAATGAAIGAGTALYAGAKDIKRAYKFHKATMEETELAEGKWKNRAAALAHGVKRAAGNLPVIPLTTGAGLVNDTAWSAATGDPKLMGMTTALGAAMGAGYVARQGVKGYKYKRGEQKTLAKLGYKEYAEETEVNEGANMRLIKTFTAGPHSAKVYKDREWGEYRVQFHKDGKHLKKADSHHDDRDDAFGTAQHQLKRMAGVNEEITEGFAAAHNALQDRIRNFAQSLPSRMKSAATGAKQKAVATYNDLEDKYQGGPQRRAMQLAKAVKAKKDQQVARISGKASGYENKAKDLTSYASQSLAKAEALKRQSSQVSIPNHNMHQVTTTDAYERNKAEIANATATKTKLAADAEHHKNMGLDTYNAADQHAARAAKIKDRLDAALAGRSKLLGRGKPKPTAFKSRLKKVERSV